MLPAARRVRDLAALMVGSMLVHQLHYAFDGAASDPGPSTAHAYLPLFGLFVGLLVVVATGSFVRAVRQARAGVAQELTHRSYARRWLGLFAALLTIFAVQESVEAVVISGPSAALSLLAHAGPQAVLLAAAVAAGLALVLKGADAVLAAVARPRLARRRAAGGRWDDRPPIVTPRKVLSLNLAGRAPPLGA